jgi:hypothetical protein
MVSTKCEGNLPCRGGSVCLFNLWCLQLKESYVQHVAIIARFELSVWLRTNELVAGKYPGLYNLAGHCWHVCRCLTRQGGRGHNIWVCVCRCV